MIAENVRRYLEALPSGVLLLAATKTRTVDEIMEAIDAGVNLIGENYVQEAYRKYEKIGKKAEWHLIGHLQSNKVKKACEIFDVIETVDSVKIAELLNRRCMHMDKTMPVMIEINSGREKNKAGVMPENTRPLAERIHSMDNLRLVGLMTMGPAVQGEEIRQYFRLTREIFDDLRDDYELKYLSMGMTSSWRIAVEEGANIVRIGSGIFGPRD